PLISAPHLCSRRHAPLDPTVPSCTSPSGTMGHWEGWTHRPTVGIPRRFDPSADHAPALASARPGAAHDDPLQRKALPRPRYLPAASRPIASLALAAVLAGGAVPAPVAAGDRPRPPAAVRHAPRAAQSA